MIHTLTRNQKLFVAINLITIVASILLVRFDIFNSGPTQTAPDTFEVWIPSPIVIVFVVSGLFCELTENKRSTRTSSALIYSILSGILFASATVFASFIFWEPILLTALVPIGGYTIISYVLQRILNRRKIKDINAKDAFQ